MTGSSYVSLSPADPPSPLLPTWALQTSAHSLLMFPSGLVVAVTSPLGESKLIPNFCGGACLIHTFDPWL